MKKRLDKLHAPAWLVAVLGTSFVLRIPSFLEPFTYGDEMIYLSLGEAIRKGLILYKDIHDNKPPLLYFLAGLSGNLFWFKALLAAASLAAIFFFWKLTKNLFSKSSQKPMRQIAVIAFALLTTLPVLEGTTANAENFLILPVILGFLTLLTKKLDNKSLFTAGLFFSLAALFKLPASFDLLAALFFLLIATKKPFQKSAYLIAGFAAPILASIAYYTLRGALNEYLVAAFLQNVGYLSSWRPATQTDPFLVRNFPLIVRGLIMLTALATLFVYRKKLSKPFILASAWLATSLFAATLSERPYPHYLLQAVPPLAIFITMLIKKQSKEQVLSLIPIFFFVLVPVYYKYYGYDTAGYYKRFTLYATGQISQSQYFDMFDGNVNRNYRIANLIRQTTGPKDHIFVWGDSPAIYALTKRFPPLRFVATYHINDFSTQDATYQSLNANPPEIIVVLPNSPDFPLLNKLLLTNYARLTQIDGGEVFRLIDPKVLGITN